MSEVLGWLEGPFHPSFICGFFPTEGDNPVEDHREDFRYGHPNLFRYRHHLPAEDFAIFVYASYHLHRSQPLGGQAWDWSRPRLPDRPTTCEVFLGVLLAEHGSPEVPGVQYNDMISPYISLTVSRYNF